MSETLSQPVILSESAVKRISSILSKTDGRPSLRISVEGGGCSGFSYKYDLTEEREDDDLMIERDGARVVVDPVSLVYLEGSVVDFIDDLMGQSFQIRNPNAVASCGCGTSFSI